MTFFNRLEKHLSRFAIPGLTRYIVIFNALIFVLALITPGYISYLTLDPAKILQGEVWRLVTYIFIPTTMSYFWIIFALMFLWWVGDELEATWGTYRLNLFYFSGMFFNTVALFFLEFFALRGGYSASIGGTSIFLNFSLLLAFATLFPDAQLLLLIFPVKAKWMAWIYVGFLVLQTFFSPLIFKISILISFFNYFIFFGPDFLRAQFQRGKVAARRTQFQQASMPGSEALHQCAVCGKTELSNPELDFRISEDGNDYCTAHLPKSRRIPAEK